MTIFGKIRSTSALLAVAGSFLLPSSAPYAERLEFPGRHNMVNVTAFGANGSDQTSDQTAIVAAIGPGGNFPNPRVIYFPAGTYIADSVLDMGGNHGTGVNCCLTFQGQGPGVTVIKLKENSTGFGSASTPKAFIITEPGNMSFRYCIYGLTVEIGSGNAGAMAVDYICNNRGSIENVEITADGDAFVGLEMTRAWPGPCLIKDLTVNGFNYGIRVAQGQYSVTFDNIALQNQKTTGLLNQGNYLPINGLTSVNTVTAVRGGSTILIDADLRTPQGQTSTGAAIVVPANNFFYARNISASGYAAVLDNNGTLSTQNPLVEFSSATASYGFHNDTWGSLKLPIKHSPAFHDNDTNNWVCTADHLEAPPAGGTARPSLRLAIEYAAANGKSTVYAQQQGQVPYPIFSSPVTVPPQVKNLVGFDCQIRPPSGSRARIDITGNTSDPLIIEGWNFGGVTINHQSNRPVVIKHCSLDSVMNGPGAGDLFLEDMDARLELEYPQNVWIRQINPEDQSGASPYFRIHNNGGRLWVLGIKTEGVGNVINTTNNGSTEVVGGVLYPLTTSVDLGVPAFMCTDACMTLMFLQLRDQKSYQTLIRETRAGDTDSVTTASMGSAWVMPMFVANKGCASAALDGPDVRSQVLGVTVARHNRLTVVRGPVSLGPDVATAVLCDLRGRTVAEYRRVGESSVQQSRVQLWPGTSRGVYVLISVTGR